MATLSEMRDRVLDSVKRPGFTDATEVDRLINVSYRELLAKTRTSIFTLAKVMTPGEDTFLPSMVPFPDFFTNIRRIIASDPSTAQAYPMEQVSPSYIYQLRETQSTSGGPLRYYAIEGNNLLLVYPAIPDTGTTTFTFSYVLHPSPLVLDADTPSDVPDEFHEVIVMFAIAKAVRVWNPQYGALYEQRAKAALDDYRRFINRSGGAWMAKAVVTGSRVVAVPHDNSVYYSGGR